MVSKHSTFAYASFTVHLPFYSLRLHNPCLQGTYMLSNLLQELALAKDHGRKRIVLDESRLTENPVDRLSRMIKASFWNALTRRIDGDGLEIICADPKNRTVNVKPLIYVPYGEPKMAEYYHKESIQKPHLGLRVEVLPRKCDDPAFVKSLNDKPGILALAMQEVGDGMGGTTLKGIPFVVPGARFNEVRIPPLLHIRFLGLSTFRSC